MVLLAAAFPTSMATPGHVQIAEELGYARAWLYDTPQQSPDVWMVLGLTAERTTSIGLGPGVLVPTLRHPMVNAAGAAGLAKLAPGRAAVAFGTGYTGRRAMGQPKPIPWSYISRYVTAFCALLAGGTAEWEGVKLRMLHDETSVDLPVDIPIYIGATGPKGLSVAGEVGGGLFVAATVPDLTGFDDVACLVWGTVLDEGELASSERVRSAAGPGVAQTYHGAYEMFGAEVTASLPGGPEWLAVIQAVPEDERHFAVHQDHCFGQNEADRAAWEAGAHTLAEHVTLTGTAGDLRAKIAGLAEQGVTELVYQPAGDIAHELETFAQVVDGL